MVAYIQEKLFWILDESWVAIKTGIYPFDCGSGDVLDDDFGEHHSQGVEDEFFGMVGNFQNG